MNIRPIIPTMCSPRAGFAPAALALALSLLPTAASGLELVYIQTTGSRTVRFEEGRSPTPDGFQAFVKTDREESSVVLGRDFQTERWGFRLSEEKTDITAIRTGALIRISGVFKGRPYEKSEDAGSLPWYEFHELSMDGLPAAAGKGFTFVTIDRTNLKLVRFFAEKKGVVNLVSMGASVRALEYDLTVEGIPAFLFRSRFWLRELDGRYLKLSAPAVAGLGATSIVELAVEKAALEISP